MERREFIALCGIGVLLQSCKTAFYAPSTYVENQLTVRKADITGKGMFLVKSDKLQAPLCLSDNNGQYAAVLMLCTHKSCELSPAGNYLHCPCHGSEFTAQGKLTQGPAEEDLKTYPVTTDNENIYIHIQ